MKVKDFVCETNWCQRALCIDSEGVVRHWPYASDIVKWDLVGMVILCYPGDEVQQEILTKVKQHIGCVVHNWNDKPDRTWQDVRQLAEELNI